MTTRRRARKIALTIRSWNSSVGWSGPVGTTWMAIGPSAGLGGNRAASSSNSPDS